MIKKKMWLIAVNIVAITFSVNALAMMDGNNGYNNQTQRYNSSGSHMSDFDKGLYHRDNYGVPRSDYSDNLNGNHYDSRMHDYNRGYQRNDQGPYKDNNFRGNYNRNFNSNMDRYRDDHRYQRD